MQETFRKLANRIQAAAGSPFGFLFANLFIVIWLLCGPAAGFSDTWQLIANTVTTLITFDMGFLILYSENRHARALMVKMDELIRAGQASNRFIGIENASDEELHELESHLRSLRGGE
jgi:low affinity Fe/Cu permease